MSKILICLIIFVSTFSYTSISFAEETGTTTDTVEVTQNQAPEKRISLSQNAQTRLTNLAANISNRHEAYIRRINNVNDRLASRSEKMATLGFDVTEANNKITEAKAELEKAKAALANIDTTVNQFIQSENPRAYWPQVKNTYTSSKEAIKAAHRATVEALLLLKSATKTSTETDTSSTTSDTNNL